MRDARGKELKTTGALGEGAPPDTYVGTLYQDEVPKQVVDGDNRSNIDWAKDYYPWNNHGRMYDYGSCTAFKIWNHLTGATAAHCVHTGSSWKTKKNIEFGTRGGIGSGPNSCYGITVPGCWDGNEDNPTCDYAVLTFNTCDYNKVNVGYLGYWTLGNNVDDICLALSGYPATGLPAGWTYPTLALHNSCNGYTRPAYPNRLFYFNDTTAGQSGTPAFWDYSGGHYVRGIHAGTWNDKNQGRKMDSTLVGFIQAYSG